MITMHLSSLYLVAATLNFEQEMYTVNEANGTAQPVLVLSNQLPSYFTVNICNINGTATGTYAIC